MPTLSNAQYYLRKYWYLVVLGLIIIALPIAQRLTTTPPTPPPPSTTPSWRNLTPDQSTLGEVNQVLGRPQTQSRDEQGRIRIEYKSDEKFAPHEVVYDQNIAQLIIQRTLNAPPGGMQVYYQELGDSPDILEPTEAHSNIFLYVWPDRGIAVKAHAKDGKVFEVWYFTPTSLANFESEFSDIIGTPPPEGEY